MKRVYEKPEPGDGRRVLIDRLWPRGLTKAAAHVDEWRKDLAPSDALRRWFGHDPARWEEFRRRYLQELDTAGRLDDLRDIGRAARTENITLLFAARDAEHCNAAVLKRFIEKQS